MAGDQGLGAGACWSSLSCWSLCTDQGSPGMPGVVAELNCPGLVLSSLPTASLWVKEELKSSLEKASGLVQTSDLRAHTGSHYLLKCAGS